MCNQTLRYNYDVYLTSPYGATWLIVAYDYMSNISAFYTFLNCTNEVIKTELYMYLIMNNIPIRCYHQPPSLPQVHMIN